MFKKLKDYLTGYDSCVGINISDNPKINTINPEFANIKRDDSYVQEIAKERAKLDGVLYSTDIIRDTFKRPIYENN